MFCFSHGDNSLLWLPSSQVIAATTILAAIKHLHCLFFACLSLLKLTLLPVVSVHLGHCLSAYLFEGRTVLCAKLRPSQLIICLSGRCYNSTWLSTLLKPRSLPTLIEPFSPLLHLAPKAHCCISVYIPTLNHICRLKKYNLCHLKILLFPTIC